MKSTQRIGIYIYDDVELLDMAGPMEVFTTATRVSKRLSPDTPPCFETFTLACHATKVRSRAGLWIEPDHVICDHPPLDVLLVPGGVVTAELKNDALQRWLVQTAPKTPLVSSVCTGVFLLAQAGLLEGRPVTTHWEDIAELRRDHPTLTVLEGMRWVDTGPIVTSAGISAGIDMSLHLVERLAGRTLALQTARQMEVVWTENPQSVTELKP